MRRNVLLCLSILTLARLAVAPVSAAPAAAPCTPGSAYNPACDVDHDGDVDIFDVQLAAGHWNQAGVYSRQAAATARARPFRRTRYSRSRLR